MFPRSKYIAPALVAMLAYGTASSALATPDDKVKPGELYINPPTLINLAFDWPIEGDDNRNASVTVEYRKKGDSNWQRGMDLFRLNGERVLSNVRFDVISPNMFTGSILDLEEDTEYEVRLTMNDPDGVRGVGLARKNVTVRTRAEPKPYSGGRVFHVYPHGTPNDIKIQPAFEGLLDAYNNCGSGTDMDNGVPPTGAGWRHDPSPRRNRTSTTVEFYTNTASLSRVPFDGTYYLHGTGTADKPIVNQGRRRRRGHLRRQWRVQLCST